MADFQIGRASDGVRFAGLEIRDTVPQAREKLRYVTGRAVVQSR